MLDFLRTRWSQGTRTSSFPEGGAEFPDRFRGRPALDASRCQDCRHCRDAMPSSLLSVGSDGAAALDVGACLFSPEEAAACPSGAIRYTVDHRLSARTRSGLVSATGDLEPPAPLDEQARRLFGRSLRLRSVAAGSCNGCEAELVALGNVVFDLARFGIQFVASPRHADGMVVTGAVSRNMHDAVLRTYEAIPEPRLVIAVGACAVNGGPFRGAPEVGNGVPAEIPVDLWIAGCPPHPLTVLDAMLNLLGRLADGQRRPSIRATTGTA
jgi:Ni,Fe-hydrogenase III small subunit/formate hydrogenlyase subunit 6/NADH:ubiquinone oxidoreductase subunit I